MASSMKTWTKEDIPRLEDVEKYLDMIQAIRNTFPELPGLPDVPADMEGFTFREANDIEKILSQIGWAVEAIPQSRVYSGEFQSGGI